MALKPGKLKSDLLGLSSLAKNAVSYEERQKLIIKNTNHWLYMCFQGLPLLISFNKCSKGYTKES